MGFLFLGWLGVTWGGNLGFRVAFGALEPLWALGLLWPFGPFGPWCPEGPLNPFGPFGPFFGPGVPMGSFGDPGFPMESFGDPVGSQLGPMLPCNVGMAQQAINFDL